MLHTKKLPSARHPIVDEYALKYEIYENFCIATRTFLKSVLAETGCKYQMSYRVKEVGSLSEKIERKKREGKIYTYLSDMEDVAGLRIVFYTKVDRDVFIKKLASQRGCAVRFEETARVPGYRSTHAILHFTEERTSLSEYEDFRGLKCEVQMTLILNHAWAELEHDILYKEGVEIEGIHKERYEFLKKRMDTVMSEYIHRATAELDVIISQINELKAGKKESNELFPQSLARKGFPVSRRIATMIGPAVNE